jgi:hypothetical protein
MERRTFEESFRDAFKDAEATPSEGVWKNIESELERGRIAMGTRTFEDSLKNALVHAEATPSEQVWNNVELELEKEKGSRMRRSLAFYQMLAAAAVALALLSTGVAYYIISQKDQTIEQMVSDAAQQRKQDNGQVTQRPALPDSGLNNAGVYKGDESGGATGPLVADNGTRQSAGSDQQSASRSSGQHAALGPSNASGNPGTLAGNETTPVGVSGGKDAFKRGTEAVAPNSDVVDSNIKANANNGAYSAIVAGTNHRPGDSFNDASSTANVSNGNPSNSNALNISGANGSNVPATELAGNASVAGNVRELPSFYKATIKEPAVPVTDPVVIDPVAKMMAELAAEEARLAGNDEKKKDFSNEKVWTALGVAAGGFSSVNHSTAPVMTSSSLVGFTNSNNQAAADKQARANGVAYSMGLSFGTRVAPRWVLQGGVNYLTQSSNYTANNVVYDASYSSLKAESINALGKIPGLADAANAQNLAPTVPYSVNNSLKYFSLPMQAGYLLVNKKFGLQLNAGVSTDLFLQNTITPEGGSLDKTTQSSGSDSPYRTVNFSGLMGTEFSYRLGQRYRVALNPAIRYPFSSVYKSDVGIQSTPLTFDVGLRFRYIFK